jgi:cell division protein FtsB
MLLAVADCVRCLPALFEARQQASGLRRDVAELGRATETLRRDVKRLNEDPKAIEEIARRELGLMRPGEVVFIIVDTPDKTAGSR